MRVPRPRITPRVTVSAPPRSCWAWVHRSAVNLGEGMTEGQKKPTVPEVLIDADPIITVRITVIRFNKIQQIFADQVESPLPGLRRTGPPGGLLGGGGEITVCQETPRFQAPSPQSGLSPRGGFPEGSGGCLKTRHIFLDSPA